MEYKYKRGQIFGKRLEVPKDILVKVYNNKLSFKEFIEYGLEEKIPITCVKESDRHIISKFGIEKAKLLDWDLLDSKLYYSDLNLKELVMNMDNSLGDLNQSLYELVKDKIRPSDYSKEMKLVYKDRLFENTEDNGELSLEMKKFNEGNLSLEDIVNNWDLFKDKDLSYCLLNNNENIKGLTDSNLKSFMNSYGNLVPLIYKITKNYDFINDIMLSSKEEQVRKIKYYTDEILKSTNGKYDDYRAPITLNNEQYNEIFKYSSLEEYLKKYDKYGASIVSEELKRLPQDYISNMSIPLESLCSNNVLYFIRTYGLKNVVDFDNECGHFFTKNNCEMLNSMFDMYMHYAGNERDPNKTIFTKSDVDNNGNYVDRPYTKDEFYEAMKRMIVNGPSDSNYINKAPDYRQMTGEFRTRNAQLFISNEAPEELQRLFYTKSITPHLLASNPEFIQFLYGKDLSSCFKPRDVRVNGSTSLYEYENFYNYIGSKMNFNDTMNFITEYRDIFEIVFDKGNGYNTTNFSSNDSINEIEGKINDSFKKLIMEKRIVYPPNIPRSMKVNYPSMFLNDESPKELKDAFYNRTINSEFILSNPIYKNYLKNVDLELLYENMPIKVLNKDNGFETLNLASVVKDVFGKEDSLDLMLLYGKYIEEVYNTNKLKNFKINSDASKSELLDELDSNIYQSIINNKMKYDEKLPSHFKNNNKELFLDDSVSNDIKEKFYNRELTINDILNNEKLIQIFNDTNFFVALNMPNLIGKISKNLFMELYHYDIFQELLSTNLFSSFNELQTTKESFREKLWEYTKTNFNTKYIILLKKLGYNNPEIEIIERKIKELCVVRPEFTETNPSFNYHLLDDEIINKFGYGFISELLNYNSGAVQIFLNKCDQDIIIKWINYLKKANIYDDKLLHYIILNYSEIFNLMENLIHESYSLTPNDCVILREIIKNNNEYNIKSLEELNDYSSIKKTKLHQGLASKNINMVKDATLKTLFDVDMYRLNNIISTYGLDSDLFISQIIEKKHILAPEMIAAIQVAREIINGDNIENIREYAEVGNIGYVNFNEIEKQLKLFYGNKLNNSLSKEKNENIQNVDGINIVNFEGEKFKLLIHRLYSYDPKFGDFASQIIEDPSKWNTLDGATTLSTSMISENHLKYVSSGKDYPAVYYGFTEVNNDDLMFMGRRDIFVSHGGWQLEPTSNLNEFMDFDTLQVMSDKYNEVAIQRKKQSGNNIGKKIQPNCIICFDGIINEESKKAARYFNIPIYNINQEKYKEMNSSNDLNSMLYHDHNFIDNLKNVINLESSPSLEEVEYLLDSLAFYTTHTSINKEEVTKLTNDINMLKNKININNEEVIYNDRTR